MILLDADYTLRIIIELCTSKSRSTNLDRIYTWGSVNTIALFHQRRPLKDPPPLHHNTVHRATRHTRTHLKKPPALTARSSVLRLCSQGRTCQPKVRSQGLSTGSYVSLINPIVSPGFILMLSNHLRPRLPSDQFPSGFPTMLCFMSCPSHSP
jgi:hypothetical protein